MGYVGLPVFISLKKKFKVTGFDTNKERVTDLNYQIDTNNEFSKNELKLLNKSLITNKKQDLKKCNFYIIMYNWQLFRNYYRILFIII